MIVGGPTIMKQNSKCQLVPLGQVGYRFQFGPTVVFIDPYLSDYVEEVEGPDLRRSFPAPFPADAVCDADWVLVTHAHIDHCDPRTIGPLALASPSSRFIGPPPVLRVLRRLGIDGGRLHLAPETTWLSLGDALQVTAVPAAHPQVVRDPDGHAESVGYVLEFQGRRFYHAGDTSVADELMQRLKDLAPLEIGFLPVNERNFFKDRRGIIGNMTLREAFGLADEIGTQVVVPTHWDMFKPNAVPREEIELLYQLLRPACHLALYPHEL